LSPLKVIRNSGTCIDCRLCTKACPSSIAVHKVGRVRSDECTACFKCVEACPVKDTLHFRLGDRGRIVPPWVFGMLLVGTFAAIVGMAMLTGNWQNSISREEYLGRFREIETPAYEHFAGSSR